MSKAIKMNDHVYRKLKRLYDSRDSHVTDFEKARAALLYHNVTEAALVVEIERREKK
jgi:hypothetical protein